MAEGTRDESVAGTGPLDDIRVLELGSMVAAPFAAAALGSLGADVVKVEPLTGDPARGFAPMAAPDHVAPAFLASNAGKRSIALDLATDDGRDIVLKLIARSDIVIDNFRPGGLVRRGIDADALCAQHPRLIWVSVSGYGQHGPNADRSAVDQIIQAEAGVVAVTGPPQGFGYRAGFHVVDHATAHVIAAKCLAALLERGRTGRGRRIRQALYDVALSLQSTSFAEYFVTGNNPRRTGNASPLSAPSDIVRTKDGAIMLVAYLEPHWNRMCTLIGRVDLLTDPRFLGRANRVKNRELLVEELEQTTRQFTSEHLAGMLEEAGVMVGRVLTYDTIAASDEVTQNHLFTAVTSPEGHTYSAIRSVYDTAEKPRLLALPGLGQHTREILAELGDDARFEQMLAGGVIGQAEA